MDNLRISKLREYLMNIIATLDEEYQQLNINFLSNEVDNYSLDKIPTPTDTDQWIIGPIFNTEVYSFRSRMNYSPDVITNIENIGFYERFAKIIKYKNENGYLPDIKGIDSIKCLNVGTMNTANTNTAEFDIQIQIEYRDTIDDIIPSM